MGNQYDQLSSAGWLLRVTPMVSKYLLYVAPSLLVAALISFFSVRLLTAWFVRLPATLIHEALHMLMGFFTFGGPVNFSFLPRRVGPGRWRLGSVGFRNLTWYNSALIALAPFLSLPLAAWIVWWRVQNGQGIALADLGYWFLIGEMLIAAWPSPTDYHQRSSLGRSLLWLAQSILYGCMGFGNVLNDTSSLFG